MHPTRAFNLVEQKSTNPIHENYSKFNLKSSVTQQGVISLNYSQYNCFFTKAYLNATNKCHVSLKVQFSNWLIIFRTLQPATSKEIKLYY